MQSNQEIYKGLLPLVVDEVLGDDSSRRIVRAGPLEINCFSMCFWVNLMVETKRQDVYVKIPRIILFGKQEQHVFSLSSEDRRLAEDEYRSLVYLSEHWRSDDIEVRFIEPLGFIREFNAIITERFHAGSFLKLFRTHDVKRKLLVFREVGIVSEAMSRLGRALARFHDGSYGKSVAGISRSNQAYAEIHPHSGSEDKRVTFRAEETIGKIGRYLLVLREYGVDAGYLDGVAEKLVRYRGFAALTQASRNLKGFDIRQVFIDDSERLFLLDPGRLKDGCREVDIARFIVTCRILYWGSAGICLHLTPNTAYEVGFLSGYCSEGKMSEDILHILIVKELFKHWKMACFSLEKRPWPEAYKQCLRMGYMNPFYRGQISLELRRWGTE